LSSNEFHHLMGGGEHAESAGGAMRDPSLLSELRELAPLRAEIDAL
jgi:hypothetical protein